MLTATFLPWDFTIMPGNAGGMDWRHPPSHIHCIGVMIQTKNSSSWNRCWLWVIIKATMLKLILLSSSCSHLQCLHIFMFIQHFTLLWMWKMWDNKQEHLMVDFGLGAWCDHPVTEWSDDLSGTSPAQILAGIHWESQSAVSRGSAWAHLPPNWNKLGHCIVWNDVWR